MHNTDQWKEARAAREFVDGVASLKELPHMLQKCRTDSSQGPRVRKIVTAEAAAAANAPTCLQRNSIARKRQSPHPERS
jgi:hypothetical protein